MHRIARLAAAALLLFPAAPARATPSTVVWTPATTYTQPYLVPHVTYDSYFGEPGAYPITTGLTVGVLPTEKLQGEVGFDLLYPNRGKSALLLNAKLTLSEGAVAGWAPGLSVGIAGVGLERDFSDYNLLHASLGKGIGPAGTLAVGVYYGLSERLFLDAVGRKKQFGVMASWVSPDVKVGLPGLDKIAFGADVQSGSNVFGAVGAGAAFSFTPSIGLILGPVFFLEKDLQPGRASWLFTVQLDVDVELMRKP